jgi:hypothetical protein
MIGQEIASGGGHLEDGVLMQLVDGDAAAPAGAREHLAGCAGCANRVSALERAAGVLRASLPDVPMPRMALPVVKRRQWVIPIPVAIAATVVALASAAAATPSIRRWVADRLSPAASRGSMVGPTISPPLDARRATVTASFIPTDSVLTIRVARAQTSGAIHLVANTGEKVSAQAVGNIGTEELVVSPTGIGLTNTATSVADYRIAVPASVRSIRLTIAGKEAAVVMNDGHLDRRIPLR